MMGIQIIDMGIFLGIALGLIVAYVHNKFIDVELKGALQIYGGSRLVFIVLSFTMILLAIISTHIWPIVQHGINTLSIFIESTGVFGIFTYGFLDRILIPTGLHHLIYPTFLYTNFGGSEMVEVIQNGEKVSVLFEGARNIYNAQLSNIDSVTRLTKSVVWDARGITKIFGLWGAVFAMYQTAKPENKIKTKAILLSAMGASIIAGVTEPIEFSFLFTAPILFVAHAVIAGLGMVVFSILDIRTIIPNGVIDFLLMNIPVGIDRTSWPMVFVIGIGQAVVYYFVFRFLITKLNLKTPGRELVTNDSDIKLGGYDAEKLLKALGGKENIVSLDNCITRLRLVVNDMNVVNEDEIKATGAIAVVKLDATNLQVIIGPQVHVVKNKLDKLMK